MAASLQGLPTELLGFIAEYCCGLTNERQALLNLRLASRTIESAVRRSWIQEYFAHRNVDIDEFALESLMEVSDIPEFAREVKVLRIRCKDDFKHHLDTDSSDTPQAPEGYERLCRMMYQAFRNFQGVETIEFVPNVDGIRDQCTDKGDAILDYGITFSYVLFIVQKCGLLLHHIRRAGLEYHPCDAEFRMSAAVDLPAFTECCSDLKSFDTKISLEVDWDAVPSLAKAFATGFNGMASLTNLSLDFAPSSNWAQKAIFFRELAQHTYLPQLATIDLGSASCFLREMTAFLSKHITTLTWLRLSDLDTFEMDMTISVRAMLERLKEASLLEHLDIERFVVHGSGDKEVTFPNVHGVVVDEFENLDGYVMINHRKGVQFSGIKEVQKGLENMLSHIVIGPSRS